VARWRHCHVRLRHCVHLSGPTQCQRPSCQRHLRFAVHRLRFRWRSERGGRPGRSCDQWTLHRHARLRHERIHRPGAMARDWCADQWRRQLFARRRLLGNHQRDSNARRAIADHSPYADKRRRGSWPSPSTGFSLQQALNLITPAWNPPAESVLDNGTDKFIIVNPPTGNRFYRLFRP